MKVPSYFTDFLTAIRPTEAMRTEYRDAHTLLRKRLRAFEPLKEALVADFLQGSYRRWTLIRPADGCLADVDIIIVTRLSPAEWTPSQVLSLFTLFAKEHYDGKYKVQGRSICITLSGVALDLVPTGAPSEEEIGVLSSMDLDTLDDLEGDQAIFKEARLMEAREAPKWKLEPLQIPDRDAGRWERTHPLAQLAWTRVRNAASNGHFVNVIKALKWWRRETLKGLKRLKGYPLERAFAECFPLHEIDCVAEGLTLTMEAFVSKFRHHRVLGLVPTLPDYGVPEQDVMKRITAEEFAALFDAVETGATIARAALNATDLKESVDRWRQLLGPKFPASPEQRDKPDGGFSPRIGPSAPRPGRFA